MNKPTRDQISDEMQRALGDERRDERERAMIHKGRMTPAQIRAVIADAKVRGIVGLHFCPLCGTPFTAAQPACVSCLPEWQEPGQAPVLGDDISEGERDGD